MKQFLQKKAKLVFLCMLVLLTCTACANPRGRDGKTLADQIIASEETTIDASKINYKDISDKKLKKEIKKNIKDGQYTIQPTTFKDSMSKGWFEGLIVWPIAQIINLISSKTDAGVGIILTTLLIQMLVFVFTRKSQMSTQRMQEISPEIQKIQNKYKDKTDERSKLQMAQEMQNLYQKYDIHPFGSMLITFIQLPQWLKKWQDKKDNVKVKKYAQEETNPMANSMNMSMYFMTAMICIMYISWPMAMSFYWLVSSVIRVCQSLILHQVMNKK